VNVDPFGYDHALDFTRKALAHNPDIHAEVRVAAFSTEGTIRLPIWHGMAMGGLVGKSLAGFPEQDFPCRTIDAIARDLALDRLDYLKMDIEGGEIAALEGAAETIKRFRPQLAISIYHERSHYWRIPLMLGELCPRYRFYIKHYHYNCAETLLYAVPSERPVRPRRTMVPAALE
jgi:FkbM family methyltransferase